MLWEHGSEAVGFVDPDEMYTDDRGLIIGGEIDRETRRGKLAWKMVKARSAGFSIGFASESRPRKGGGRVLTSIDLLEINVTSRPMHPRTRALSWKSATTPELTEEESETLADLRRQHEAEKEAERVVAEEERPRLHPVFPPRENAEFSVAGVRVRATSRGWIVLDR